MFNLIDELAKEKQVVENMTDSDYHAHAGLGSSPLKYAKKTLEHFKAYMNGEIIFKSRDAFNLGKAVHEAILEKSRKGYVVAPKVDKRTKLGKAEFAAFEKENADKTIITEDQHTQLVGMFDKFQAHDMAKRVLKNGKTELSFFLKSEAGLLLKARTDYYVQCEDKEDYIVDYKTSDDATEYGFSKKIHTFGYDLQAAHYMDIVSKCTGREVKDYFWIVQEKSAPFGIRIYRADSDMLSRALTTRNDW